MHLPTLLLRRTESWVEFNASLSAACFAAPVVEAQLDSGKTEAVLLRGGVGRRRLVQVWPIDSDDPEARAQAHLDRANRAHPHDLDIELFHGLVLLLVPMPVEPTEVPKQALESRGRAPFGFSRCDGRLVPIVRWVAAIRAVFAAEDRNIDDAGTIARQVLEAFPDLSMQPAWGAKHRARTVVSILARREELELSL